MAMAKKQGGAKTSRTETVTVRLDPKLRYLAEIASRTQRRTLSSYIEWAIEKSLGQVTLSSDFNDTIESNGNDLWDIDEADRFVKLAFKAPTLLTYEEQILWKLIQENGYFWRGEWIKEQWAWRCEEYFQTDEKNIFSNIIWERVREHWQLLNDVALGNADKSELPVLNNDNCRYLPDAIPF